MCNLATPGPFPGLNPRIAPLAPVLVALIALACVYRPEQPVQNPVTAKFAVAGCEPLGSYRLTMPAPDSSDCARSEMK